IVVPLFFGIVVVFSLIGNILVLVIIGLYENLKSLTNIFILNLALSDLLFTFGLPFWAWYYIWGWNLGDVACKAVSFFFYAGFYSSVVFLILMTIQRYMAVVHPLSDWERRQGFALIPILAWVVSIAVALPAPIFNSIQADPENPQKLYCEYNSTEVYITITYTQNVFFVFAFVVMGFCYIRILQTIIKTRTNKRHRSIRLILCIVIVFFLGWAPYNLVMFLHTLVHHQVNYFTDCEVTHHLDYAEYVCKLLAFSHCCLNPVFYVFVGVKFRNHLKGILQKVFHRTDNVNMRQTQAVQSHGSVELKDELCHKEAVAKFGSVLVPLFFCIVFVLSIIGNSLVLGILAHYENMKSLTNIFILNLALSDLLFSVGLPFWVHYFIWGWNLGDVACKTVCFVFYAGFYSSVVFLMLMTIQRYMAVVYPLSDWEKRQGFALIPTVAWILSIGAAVPASIFSSEIPDPAHPSQLYCEYNSKKAKITFAYVQNGFFFCAFVVMGFCYSSILKTIINTRTKKRHRTMRLIFTIVVAFFLGWAPYNLVNFFQTLTQLNLNYFTDCEVTHHLDYAEYVCKLLAFSHCCLNPVFYVFVGLKFR
ncbi:chemokine XC receptor 1, partial [Silurus asotus]